MTSFSFSFTSSSLNSYFWPCRKTISSSDISVNVTLPFVYTRTNNINARRHFICAFIGHHSARQPCVSAASNDNMQQSNSFGLFESKTRQFCSTHTLAFAHTHTYVYGIPQHGGNNKSYYESNSYMANQWKSYRTMHIHFKHTHTHNT